MKICKWFRSLFRKPQERARAVHIPYLYPGTAERAAWRDDIEGIIRDSLNDDVAFQSLGQSIFRPLIETVDFEGLPGRLLSVRLDKEEQPTMFDEWSEICQISPDEIAADPLEATRRIQAKVLRYLLRREDFRFLDAAYRQSRHVSAEWLDPGVLREWAQEFKPTTILVNRQAMASLVLDLKCVTDPVTQRELVKSGYLGEFWYESGIFATVVCSAQNAPELVLPGEAWLLKSREETGTLQIFSDYTVKALPERRGWSITAEKRVTIRPGGVLRLATSTTDDFLQP